MSEKIFLTRNQLAKFLPTPEAIKAFENLFKIATQQTPNNIDEVQISAESALSMANYSLSVLDNVSKLIEALELQPPEIPTISEDIIDIPIVNINECECLEIIKEPDWNFIKNHPTTITGYGITDAYTQVVADAPLTGSGTTSSHLSIPAATALVNGYLSSTDWSTFNSKEPAQTKGSITEATSSVLTITNGSSSTVGPNVTIQVKQSTNAVSGYLSSTDWTTFNGKQAAYTNLTSIGGLANSSGWLKNNGSGTFSYSTPTATDVGLGNVTNNAQVKAITSTANKLVKFSDTSSTITNSVVYDDGTNVGIGASIPKGKLTLDRTGTPSGSPTSLTAANSYLNIGNNDYNTTYPNYYAISLGFIGENTNAPTYIAHLQTNNAGATKGDLAFYTRSVTTDTAPSERMRIDSSGKVLIGTTTSQAALTLNGGGGGSLPATYTGGINMAFGAYGIVMRTAAGGGHAHMVFQNSSGTVEGTIYSDGSSTSYITSSDYRLKEDYQDMVGATDRLKALKPINFAWKSTGDKVDGFLAHELQEVVPEAVTGTKDAMIEEEYEVTPAIYETVEHPAVEAIEATYDEDGNILTEAIEAKEAYTEKILVSEAVMGTREVPDYQGVDQSKLVPLLTKALQEAVERIEQLEARIEALEMTKQS